MRKILALAAVLAVASLVIGCVETKQDFTLNPDGSGKVACEFTMADMSFGFAPEGDRPDPEVKAKQLVKQTLDSSAGIDAWADVSYARLEDGRTRVKGIAYFRDFSKLKFRTSSVSGISFAKDDKGGMVLTISEPVEGEMPSAPTPPEKPAQPPSPDELAAKIKAERDKYQMMRPLMEAAFAKMKTDVSFRLPGTLAEVNIFQKDPGGAVRLSLEGAKMMQAMDQLVADDASLEKMVQGGGGARPKMDDAMKERIFGAKGPIMARVTGDLRPLFAYDSEVAAAKANYQAMIQRLGLDKLPPSPPPMPPGFGIEGKGMDGPAPGATKPAPAPGVAAPGGM